MAKVHEVQLVNYLVATGLDEGLLLNFGTERLEFKKKFRQRTSNKDRSADTERRTDCSQSQSVAQHIRNDSAPRGSECNANAKFARSLCSRIRNYAVNADRH